MEFIALSAMLIAIFLLFYHTSDPFNALIHRLMGYKIVECRGITSAIEGEIWRTYIHSSGFQPGVLGYAYRYPSTSIGKVTLHHDGTGFYCGNLIWRFV